MHESETEWSTCPPNAAWGVSRYCFLLWVHVDWDEEIDDGIVAVLNGDRFAEKPRRFVPGDNGVLPRRHVRDLKLSRSIRFCEPSVWSHDDGGRHVRVQMAVNVDNARLRKGHLT